jgi:peptide deformylase
MNSPLVPFETAVLHQSAPAVAPAEFGSQDFLRQVAELHRVFDQFFDQRRGVGLAAPQIGWAKRVLVAQDYGPGPRSPAWAIEVGRKAFDRLLMCNPVVVTHAGRHTCWETCLSQPDLVGMVVRGARVRIRYQDENGASRELDASGWKARILQHEIDHLDGCLCASRYLPGTTLSAQEYVACWGKASLKDAIAAFGIPPP